MRRSSRTVLIGWMLCVAAVAMLIAPPAAMGCTCTDWPTFEEAFAESEAVFRGVVTSIASAEPQYFEHVWVTLQPDAWWKGPANNPMQILTTANEGICGYPFVVGTQYLVYAGHQGSGEPLATYLCGRTHESWAGDPDIERLGPPVTVAVLHRQWGGIKGLYRGGQ